jgi:dTDP-4-amino-4,6-dideoxygalactose transaminase
MLNSPFAPWPSFSEAEAKAVQNVLMSNRVNYWTGDEGRAFEREFANWAGATHAIALANGTLALDLALHALDIGQGDEVIVTPRTFIASVSSVILAGAKPVFADVDRESGNITASTIKAVLSEKTRAIVPVHLAGWPCDMPEIMALAKQYSISVIEDCAQAHGAMIDGKHVGTFGDVGAWSFCQDKIMTTGGEGGMVNTNDADLWSKMWSFKDHGKNWDAVYNRQHAPGFRWVHESFGTNWRMLEMQSTIGRIQLTEMNGWTQRRTQIARAMANVLGQFDKAVRVPREGNRATHAYYRLYAYVRPDGLKSGWTRDRIVAEINAAGVPVMQGSCSEVYLEKAFDGSGFRPAERLPVAHELGDTSLMFFTHPTITDEQLALACNVIEHIFHAAAQ